MARQPRTVGDLSPEQQERIAPYLGAADGRPDYGSVVSKDSEEGRALIARAHRLQDSADLAFRRFMFGQVRSSAGAASLQSKAEEAWADIRVSIADGDQIEWEERNRG